MSPFDRNCDAQTDPVRLTDAADALLRAASAKPDGLALVDLWKGDVAFAPEHAFTAQELVEAMVFLLRLGLVVPRDGGFDGSHISTKRHV
jgi:hypothetical protein